MGTSGLPFAQRRQRNVLFFISFSFLARVIFNNRPLRMRAVQDKTQNRSLYGSWATVKKLWISFGFVVGYQRIRESHSIRSESIRWQTRFIRCCTHWIFGEYPVRFTETLGRFQQKMNKTYPTETCRSNSGLGKVCLYAAADLKRVSEEV